MVRDAILDRIDAVARLVDEIDLDDVAFGRANNALDEISMKAMLLSMEFDADEAAEKALAEAIARATIAIKERSAAGDYGLVLMRGGLTLLRDMQTASLPREPRAIDAATLELDMLAPRLAPPPRPSREPLLSASSLIRKKTGPA